MRQTSVYDHFAFGYNYFLLRNQTAAGQANGSPDSLAGRIETFLGKLDALGLRVTIRAAAGLTPILESLQALPAGATVDAKVAGEVRTILARIDPTLDAELQLCRAFVLTPRRLNLDHLLSSPESLLAPQVYGELPDLVRFDFRAACRCIALGLGTAAAFHMMRALEGYLRHFYCAHVKRDRVQSLMWFNMIEHLRKRHRKGLPSKALLDALDNIRVNFRNPTQHPDARYDIEAAQDLLFVTVDALNRLYRELPA